MLKGVKTYLKYASMPFITHISKFLSVLLTILTVTEIRGRRGEGRRGAGDSNAGGVISKSVQT